MAQRCRRLATIHLHATPSGVFRAPSFSARLRFALLGADFGPACVLRYSARTSAPPAFCVTRRGLRPRLRFALLGADFGPPACVDNQGLSQSAVQTTRGVPLEDPY